MPRDYICDDPTLTDEEKWHLLYGTTYVGNLPQFNATKHVGKSFAKCPYSSQADDIRTRHMLGLKFTDPIPLKVLHIEDGTEYFMKTDFRGDWGYTCTYSGCPYYLSYGKPYFYK